jgi:DNA invertase Pin-like site-specific DNA recombinase
MLLAEGVTLKSLTEEIDTRSPAGKLAFHMLAVVAQFERDVTVERTKHGVKAAQDAGLPHGRPRKLTDKQMRQIERDLANKTLSVTAIAKRYGVAAPTIRYHFSKPRVEYLKKNTRD